MPLLIVRKGTPGNPTKSKTHVAWLEVHDGITPVYAATACGQSWPLGIECVTAKKPITCVLCRKVIAELLNGQDAEL